MDETGSAVHGVMHGDPTTTHTPVSGQQTSPPVQGEGLMPAQAVLVGARQCSATGQQYLLQCGGRNSESGEVSRDMGRVC